MTYEEVSAMVVDEGNDSIYISDIDTYELIYLNGAALKMFGISDDKQWKGKMCYEVLQNKDSPCQFCTNKLLSIDEFYVWEHYNTVVNKYFLNKDKLIDLNGNLVRIEIAVDTTEKEIVFEQLQKKLLAEKTLVECIHTLSENEDIHRAIQRLLSIIGKYYGADRAYIFEVNYKKSILINTYEWCEAGVKPELNNLQRLPLTAADRWFEQFEKNGEININSLLTNVDKDSLEFEILNAQGIESLMAVPLWSENKIEGFLGVDNSKNNTDTIMLLRSAASFIINDIKKRRLMDTLSELSYMDGMTELGNRNSYIRVLEEFKSNPPLSLGVIFLDIDGLKDANDTYGHAYGDMLIQRVADVLKSVFDKQAYRIGGDEFVVLSPGISKKDFELKLHRLRKLCQLEGKRVSIGSSWYPEGKDISHQISYTDKLMYIDKQSYYGMYKGVAGNYRSILSKELLDEISDNHFTVYLQPKIALKTGKLTGAEALIRRAGTDGKLDTPDKFIPNYEAKGIIRHIDFFVLNKVCSVLNQWKSMAENEVKIAINLSRLTLLEHDIAEKLSDICKTYGVAAGRISIEVTESSSIMEQDKLSKLIYELRKKGFSVSLDDFGTEYSNLSVLTSMEFDEVKLDKSLIKNLVKSKKSQIVTSSIIDMCNRLKISVSVAEGVETLGQKKLLESFNCTVGQGFYFSRPIPIEEFTNKYIECR